MGGFRGVLKQKSHQISSDARSWGRRKQGRNRQGPCPVGPWPLTSEGARHVEPALAILSQQHTHHALVFGVILWKVRKSEKGHVSWLGGESPPFPTINATTFPLHDGMDAAAEG